MGRSQLWGDCHTHSNYSDGLFEVPEQTPHYTSFGNDFRLQTDHHIIAIPEGRPASKWLHASDWPRYTADCAAATTPRHLCIPGVELGYQMDRERLKREGWFHTKLHPPAGAPIPDESFYANKSYVEAIAACKHAGYRMIVAHIDQGAPLERFSGAELHGLEVRFDIEDQRPLFERPNLKHWDRMLTAGHRIGFSSGSDGHQPDLWAGSALRTVVLDAAHEPEAILDAVVAGRSYLSGTWHPDCYKALGWPGRPNPVDEGASITHMIPWWEFKQHTLLKDRDPREIVAEVYEAALKDGRCRREDYPVLEAFEVGGRSCGGTVDGAEHRVEIAWRAHVPLKSLRLVADGRTVYELPRGEVPLGETAGRFEARVDLRGRKYVRLELLAQDPGDAAKSEYLLGNPVYVE
ncbi:MAG: hypothetical protein M5U26_15925 [Planctomycetota bacterium]|nr:hypothetical protein [Planctomycetota bacterium]